MDTIIALFFVPVLPHTINLVSIMFYAVLAVSVIGAIMERKR